MADTVLVNHAFVSAKSDSADSTIVSASEWNADLKITGGAADQVMVREVGGPSGARWTDGPSVATGNASYTGASPSPALAAVTKVFTSNVSVTVALNITAVTSSAAAYTITMRRNTTSIVVKAGPSTGNVACARVYAENLSAGTYTYDVILSVGGGATFTASSLDLVVTAVGR